MNAPAGHHPVSSGAIGSGPAGSGPAGVVGVVGAGTMGAGIAQVAAVAGHRVLLVDAVPGAAERAIGKIREKVKAQVAKGRLSVDPDALDLTATDVAGLAGCDVVVEAIVEDLAVKKELFAVLESAVAPETILASNTSSLSPTAIAAGLANPERVVGLHFFNPVPAMKLVEVISGLATAPAVADAAAELAAGWGKTVVRAAAAPGFIVNRIARPFYAEAWRSYEALVPAGTGPEVIDAVLTGAGGFRMGPFALMDLVGHDVNEAVTRSVWSAFGHDPRYTPSLAQRSLVEGGRLGRKSGHGVYPADGAPTALPAGPCPAPSAVVSRGETPLSPLLDRSGVPVTAPSGGNTAVQYTAVQYTGGQHTDSQPGDTAAALPGGPVELPSGALLAQCAGATATALAAAAGRPVIVVDRALDYASAAAVAIAACDGCPDAALSEATGLLQAAGLSVYVIDDVPGMIVTRTVAMLVNSAADALAAGVASADDIDTAMRLGVNYPLGPLDWGRRWGARDVLTVLDSLENWHRDGHYRACSLLRRAALSGRDL